MPKCCCYECIISIMSGSGGYDPYDPYYASTNFSEGEPVANTSLW